MHIITFCLYVRLVERFLKRHEARERESERDIYREKDRKETITGKEIERKSKQKQKIKSVYVYPYYCTLIYSTYALY